MSMKASLRQRFGPSIQWLGYRSGLMAATSWLSGRGGALVLMYHSVADEEDARWIDPLNHVPAEIFERQMEFLAEHRRVVRMEQLVQEIRDGKSVEDGTVVITFDDGYRDNLTVAAPILERLGMTATLFLPTGYIDRGETQWIDQAYTAFKHATNRLLAWGENERRFDLDDPREYRDAYRLVCQALLMAGSEERRALMDRLLGSLAPAVAPPRLTLTWDEVRTLVDSGAMELGGHTVEHTDLTTISVAAAIHEIGRCRERIRDMIGSEPRHFSFCYGRSSEELRQALPGLGIDAACAARAGERVVTGSSDSLYLPRIAAPPDLRRFEVAVSTANRGLWRRLGR
ncbi:polysaccharide deacetylase family protein [Thioalkalivibrio sp. XN8]|uniref:polysaccharide deacetylase family protein n=1 Tax=Thioalkalivibrio sp. XN8 TaxID=2712863 RepID=UPI0013EDFAAA|nr:polysaccharide deacetylase family protein [Thioalkalivibrio sp. XN8]NGP53710.1 polysaccharide deacetylase family protein [Thioalkalivibrio sp. XN8]